MLHEVTTKLTAQLRIDEEEGKFLDRFMSCKQLVISASHYCCLERHKKVFIDVRDNGMLRHLQTIYVI